MKVFQNRAITRTCKAVANFASLHLFYSDSIPATMQDPNTSITHVRDRFEQWVKNNPDCGATLPITMREFYHMLQQVSTIHLASEHGIPLHMTNACLLEGDTYS